MLSLFNFLKNMAQFDFYIDEKIKTWQRAHVTVEADSEQEAVGMLKNDYWGEQAEATFYENISDVDETMTLEENDGFSTKEIYDTDENKIWENGKSSEIENI